MPLHAIMVFHDPRNWALDAQIALDVVRYGTTTRSAFLPPEIVSPGSKTYKEDGSRVAPALRTAEESGEGEPVELIFSNPDLIWRGAYGRPRLGQGGFREAFQGIHTVRLLMLSATPLPLSPPLAIPFLLPIALPLSMIFTITSWDQ
jgi:hypothetical protein